MLDRLSAVGSIMWGVGRGTWGCGWWLGVCWFLIVRRVVRRWLSGWVLLLAGAAVAAASGWVVGCWFGVRSGLMTGGLMRIITFV